MGSHVEALRAPACGGRERVADMNFQVFQDTHIGHRRRNEDRVGYWSTGQSWLLALADAMVGHMTGALAQMCTLLATMLGGLTASSW